MSDKCEHNTSAMKYKNISKHLDKVAGKGYNTTEVLKYAHISNNVTGELGGETFARKKTK